MDKQNRKISYLQQHSKDKSLQFRYKVCLMVIKVTTLMSNFHYGLDPNASRAAYKCYLFSNRLLHYIPTLELQLLMIYILTLAIC